MVHQDIVRYFREGKLKGFTNERLKAELLKNGFNIADIDEAIGVVEGNQGHVSQNSMPVNKNMELNNKPAMINPVNQNKNFEIHKDETVDKKKKVKDNFGSQMMTGEKEKVPVPVKIISVLDWIGAIGGILMGVLLIVMGVFILVSDKAVPDILDFLPIELLTSLSWIVIAIGAGILIFSIFLISMAVGLWRGSNWARISQIIIGFLIIALSVWNLIYAIGLGDTFSLVMPIVYILIEFIIVAYLLFSKKVKMAFKK